jgi:peptidoglycan hydrolase-like protein with peptidoglycan-binding domain
MGRLGKSELDSAVAYNRARSYGKDTWKRVQTSIGVAADGIPGRDTAQAVADFQAKNGLGVDGKVGPGTLKAIEGDQPRSSILQSLPGESVFFYGGKMGKMAIDADGAPNAYNADDTGIDYLRNAGRPGNWWGLSCDDSGEPYKQGPDHPFPGYYISSTALADGRYKPHDPRRYVDSTKVPYFVLPRNLRHLLPDLGALRRGDLAAVLHVDKPDDIVFAIYADVGPTWGPDHVPGEGSVALAQALDHDPFHKGRVTRGISSGVFYVVFPGSGTGKPLPLEDIAGRGRQAFDAWGGRAKLDQALAAAGA